MKLTDLKPGTKLRLEVMNTRGKDDKNIFISEIEWAEDDKTLFIAAPIYEGILYPISIGSNINIYIFYRQNNSAEMDMYISKASVIDRVKDQKIAMLKVKVTGNVIKIQRRQFFRFNYTLPVKYREINLNNSDTEEDINKIREIDFKSTVTKDISGGGICIALEEKIEKDKILEFRMKLADDDEICFTGKVVRDDKLFDSGKYKYEAGIAFEVIDEKDREKIIGFIFFEQRKLRKKGLI